MSRCCTNESVVSFFSLPLNVNIILLMFNLHQQFIFFFMTRSFINVDHDVSGWEKTKWNWIIASFLSTQLFFCSVFPPDPKLFSASLLALRGQEFDSACYVFLMDLLLPSSWLCKLMFPRVGCPHSVWLWSDALDPQQRCQVPGEQVAQIHLHT